MALNLTQPFTIFAPNSPSSTSRTPTELRFSRWNNANAEKFNRPQREQKEIEDDIRRERRYESASAIVDNHQNTTTIESNNQIFKSIGTPSSPSRPSIPGKKSKYSKNPNPRKTHQNPNSDPHPAFRRFSRVNTDVSKVPIEAKKGITIGDNGVSYKIPNAPFEFQYSYTETPKVKPLALREPPFVPFGPSTMPRPWTGRAPLPGTKKKLPEFDSFRLPPPHKKGVKPVQAPGPYLAGSGPRYVRSREEILGEPLTDEEIKDLVQGCLKTRRQLNMGRDGLTHNMLDNVHALWKRRRVCKIKCKGVCTVDMDNVCQQLEEKTGGKIIYSKGGVLFLFRGRNYNFRSRPRFPLMLWKPVTPIYPRLIMHAPEGLTLEEATEMRKRGRKLPPICKLGKNGVYSDLVKHVREAFEECELVRINCQGMNPSDFKKIGGKLKDLVPCVLISFEREHILAWRGRDWKSSFTKSEDESKEVKESEMPVEVVNTSNHEPSLVDSETSKFFAQKSSDNDSSLNLLSTNVSLPVEAANLEENKVLIQSTSGDLPSEATDPSSSVVDANESSTISDNMCSNDDKLKPMPAESMADNSEPTFPPPTHFSGHVPLDAMMTNEKLQVASEGSPRLNECSEPSSTCTKEVIQLLKQAMDIGSAVILDDASLDADIVYDRTVSLAKVAPPGPVFRQRRVRKVVVRKREKQESGEELKVETLVTVSGNRIEKSGNRSEKKSYRNPRIKDFKDVYPDSLPQGSLGVDELAKLLS